MEAMTCSPSSEIQPRAWPDPGRVRRGFLRSLPKAVKAPSPRTQAPRPCWVTRSSVVGVTCYVRHPWR